MPAAAAILLRTNKVLSMISTFHFVSAVKAGARSATPVRKLKQAWCQEQRISSPATRPSASGPP